MIEIKKSSHWNPLKRLATRNLRFIKVFRTVKLNRMAEGTITTQHNNINQHNTNQRSKYGKFRSPFQNKIEGKFQHGSSAT